MEEDEELVRNLKRMRDLIVYRKASAVGVWTISIRDIGRPPGLNEIKGMHFTAYKKVRDKWQMRIASGIPRSLIIPTPCRLTMTVFTALPMDWDNACACAKIPLDALQRLGVLAEDNPEHITNFLPLQERCPRKHAGIQLEFSTIPELP